MQQDEVSMPWEKLAMHCFAFFFADRYLGESHIEVMLFLVQLLKISRFVLKQLGSKASQVLRNQVCVFA